jgi:hypothetical protein
MNLIKEATSILLGKSATPVTKETVVENNYGEGSGPNYDYVESARQPLHSHLLHHYGYHKVSGNAPCATYEHKSGAHVVLVRQGKNWEHHFEAGENSIHGQGNHLHSLHAHLHDVHGE